MVAREPKGEPAQQTEEDTQAATGGPDAIRFPTYADAALRLYDNGYLPIPIVRHQKRPAVSRWSSIPIDLGQVERWAVDFAHCGIGLRTGTLVGIDIDILDQDIAHQMGALVEARLGATMMRVGLWPKRLSLYRTDQPFAKMAIDKVEVLALGQQFVAFGLHPTTKQPYHWPTHDSPLDCPLGDLPLVSEAACEALLGELASLVPEATWPKPRRTVTPGTVEFRQPVRDDSGLVVDGRDGWLSSLAYNAVQDSVDAAIPLDAEDLADRVWQRFTATTDIARTKQDGRHTYSFQDALQKVRDKLALLQAGRLPPRASIAAEPVEVDPGLPVEEARQKLGDAISEFCARVEAWLKTDRDAPAPRVGLRASVGLGKTAVSREHLLQAQARLKAEGLPHRILIFTPSLALADESAENWTRDDLRVAVHRGYEAKVPGMDVGMCRDIDMVRMAIASGQSVFPNACMRRGGSRCHNFDGCAKQDNLQDVGNADVVLAAYDSLFSGLAIAIDQIAVIVIDEGCWERAVAEISLTVTDISRIDEIDQPRMVDPVEEENAWTELCGLRKSATEALLANGAGVLSRQFLVDVGLTVDTCITGTVLEERLRVNPGLRPGLPQGARHEAAKLTEQAKLSVHRERLFRAFTSLLRGSSEQDGRITILPPDPKTVEQSIHIAVLHQIHPDLRPLPILHLDATLRHVLAATVLPGLEVIEITAAMPHMHLTAVQGRFGKTTLVEDPRADPAENRRRANRLRDCVDHVRWHAKRVAPGRTLVVTYKSIEAAFIGIPGVVTGHFKAIAGLDVFKDVALLIVIGRPLPPDRDIAQLTGAYFGHVPVGGYTQARCGLLMRDGSRRGFAVRHHEDARAEQIRAAICDDEILQAIGRGRGVNRTVDNPLEVQVLADVALPLVYDQVLAWDVISPDVFQRMLLAGIAVDSPADAALMHPELFGNAEQAKKAFQRAAFKGQNPLDITHRDLSLKSARYRRGGKGRSWQRAWWIDGIASGVRQNLEDALGALEGWEREPDNDAR